MRCRECNGTGQYVGLNKIEPCRCQLSAEDSCGTADVIQERRRLALLMAAEVGLPERSVKNRVEVLDESNGVLLDGCGQPLKDQTPESAVWLSFYFHNYETAANSKGELFFPPLGITSFIHGYYHAARRKGLITE